MVFIAHKAATDNDILSISGISEWLGGAEPDLASSLVSIFNESGVDITGGMYANGSIAYDVLTGSITIQIHGGTVGSTYMVNIDIKTLGVAPRTKRYRISLTVVD